MTRNPARPKLRTTVFYRSQSQKNDFRIHHFPTFSIDIASREVIRDGVVVAMEPRAFDLLRILVENPDRVLSKADLVDAVWADASVTKSVLARAVMKARRAIGDITAEPRLIKTVHGIGYRFCAEAQPERILPPADVLARQPSRVAREAAAGSHLRFTLLPFIGDASGPLGWEELGMLARITLSFQERSLLTAVPYLEVARILREPGKDLTVLEMGSLLGASRVVRGRSRATSDGGWEFVFQCYNLGEKIGEGRRIASHRGQLAEIVAEAISGIYQLEQNDDSRSHFAVDL
jgi:DNA-binding winged helix-turn-helix (wHTH) protein